MELKIWKAGFDVVEFNTFCKQNIVYKMQCLENGDIYTFFKAANKIGREPIEFVEELDRLTKQSQSEIVAQEITKDNAESDIADLKSQMTKYGPDQSEYKALESRLKEAQRQILMSNETIDMRSATITSASIKAQALINGEK